jgi:hypothetical protein
VSEAASPQRWGEEHEIDLGVVGASAPDPDPAPSPRRRFPRIHNAALAYAAIAIALAAAVVTVVKWSPLHQPLAETAVAAFLQAVHDGDVEGALARTDQAGASGEYLVPEALDPSWEIVTVAQVDYEEIDRGKAVAQVYAEIEAEDGSRIGHRYRVEIEGGEAVIKDAMTASEAWGALDYLDMNGVRIEIDPEVGLTSILLLPGVYEFYPDLPSTLDLEGGDAMLVLGDRYLALGSDTDEWLPTPSDTWLPTPWLLVSAEGEDAVNAALREHYDACAGDPSGDGCPFAFPADPERELAAAPGATWEITAYPEVRAERLWFEHGTGFGLQSAVPGAARVLAEITEDGESRTTLVSCPIWVDGLYATLDDEGGAAINTGLGLADERCRSVVEVE